MIEYEMMQRMLLKAESGLHRRGWGVGLAPTLCEVRRQGPGTVRLHPVPIVLDGEAGVHLLQLARVFEQDDSFARRVAQQRPDLVGMALCSEGWAREAAKDSPGDPTRELADQPGSFETRQIGMVDIFGHVMMVLRRRGEKPEIHGGAEIQGSRMPIALASMTRMIARFLPDADVPALDLLLERLVDGVETV
ncbi:MAG: hypothetical protein ABWY93_04710 [Mycobacterium sp.]